IVFAGVFPDRHDWNAQRGVSKGVRLPSSLTSSACHALAGSIFIPQFLQRASFLHALAEVSGTATQQRASTKSRRFIVSGSLEERRTAADEREARDGEERDGERESPSDR